MRTILVPTDYSRPAQNALRFALELARQTGATVHLLHVLLPYEKFNAYEYQSLWLDEYLQERRTQLERLVRRIARHKAYRDVPIETETSIGYPVELIVQTADRLGTDLIVLGTTGTTPLRRLFFGSTTGGVLENANVPVLAVPPNAKFKVYTNVALATDFEALPDHRSLVVLRELLNPERSKVNVVHIHNRLGGLPEKHAEQRLSESLADFQLEFHYLRANDVSTGVIEFLETSHAETLVTIAHHSHLMPRLLSRHTGKQWATSASVPLLVLHDTAN